MDIYVTRNGQQLGPFSREILHSKVNVGEFSGNDLAWHEGLEAWHPLGKLLKIDSNPPPFIPSSPKVEIKKSNNRGCLLFIVLIGGGILIASVISMQPWNDSPPVDSAGDQKEMEASDHFQDGQVIAESTLKAPSTAKWSSPIWDRENTGAKEIGNDVWEAFGTVDAQNSFGVPLHQNWDVFFIGKSKLPLYIEVGDVKIGNYEMAMQTAGHPVDQKPSSTP